MTFSIVGKCENTGMFGVAITTSSICVGARCPHARAGVGAVATQNITDPSLGPRLLDKMESGLSSRDAVAEILSNLEYAEYRQLILIDKNGETAVHTGSKILGIHSESQGINCFAAGNLLLNASIPAAMTRSFKELRDQHLAPRLLNSLQAGLDAGGEQGDVHSAALLVVDTQSFPLVDLRVDWQDNDTLVKLRKIWTDYEPQMLDYLTRAVNPADAPSYGVPGDL
jgi:uncharacterized Ntn-hydrolase superfamily protein